MMRIIIIYPHENEVLRRIARLMETLLKKAYWRAKVEIIKLNQIDKPEFFLENDIIILGTPCVSGDIFWPLQVKVDELIHKSLSADFSSKVISAFTVSPGLDDAKRCLNAILWAFRETNAITVSGLPLLSNMAEKEILEKINTFLKSIKKAFKK